MRRTATAILVLLVAGCGGRDDKPKPTADAASYDVDLPSGWSDRTKQISNQDNPIRFDRVFVTDR